MTAQRPYNQQTLNIRAAEFYKSIRKEKSKWKSIIDLSPMLAEFNHYIAAGDYEKAFHVYDEIFGYLTNWSENLRLIEMGEKLLEKRLFGKPLPEHMIIRIMTYICWGCFYSGQIDKGEKAALEAKMIGEKLLEQESSDDFAHKRIHEFMSIVDSVYWGFHVITGRYEHCKKILSEAEEQLKNVESTRYKARHYMWHGWALEEMGDERSFEKQFTADKLFDEVEEEKLSAFFLGDKARAKFSVSKEWAKKGQIEAGYEAYKESHRIHEKIHDDLYSMVVPNWGGHSVRHSYRFAEARKIVNAGVSLSEKAEMWYIYEKNIIYMGNLMRDKGVWNIFVNKSESEEGEEKPYEYQKKAFTFFQAAVDNYQQAAEVAEKLGLTADESMLHGKIGNIYCRLGDGDPGLFVLAEENLKKALDLAQSDTTKYGTCLNLGRLYVYEAGKIYKDS
ncbi:MAG: hypothetical protein GY795_37310, partial [Desulfobacterales bacterium]|nr:hypothetical protein [Desulfobacterales bacterium]